ncbi:MAG: type II toxin-antitoxin system VapC family toxin [Candidatus Jettenia sp. CY-1]|nr:MAG: type II toxin-antitoxin system VapC family toxin [Candidatus Jettenia sp. CY-1]
MAEIYGIIHSQLEKTGKPVGSLDTLIGAHALSVGVTLVTNNIREFKHIKSLKVMDWTT